MILSCQFPIQNLSECVCSSFCKIENTVRHIEQKLSTRRLYIVTWICKKQKVLFSRQSMLSWCSLDAHLVGVLSSLKTPLLGHRFLSPSSIWNYSAIKPIDRSTRDRWEFDWDAWMKTWSVSCTVKKYGARYSFRLKGLLVQRSYARSPNNAQIILPQDLFTIALKTVCKSSSADSSKIFWELTFLTFFSGQKYVRR